MLTALAPTLGTGSLRHWDTPREQLCGPLSHVLCFLSVRNLVARGGRSQKEPWNLSPQQSVQELAARSVGSSPGSRLSREVSEMEAGSGRRGPGLWVPVNTADHPEVSCQNQLACGSGTQTEVGMVPKRVRSTRRAGHPGPRPGRGTSVYPKKCGPPDSMAQGPVPCSPA